MSHYPSSLMCSKIGCKPSQPKFYIHKSVTLSNQRCQTVSWANKETVTGVENWSRVWTKPRSSWSPWRSNATNRLRWQSPLWGRGTCTVCCWLRQLESASHSKVTDKQSFTIDAQQKNLHMHIHFFFMSHQLNFWVFFLKVHHLRSSPWLPLPAAHLQPFPPQEHPLHLSPWLQTLLKHWRPRQLCDRWVPHLPDNIQTVICSQLLLHLTLKPTPMTTHVDIRRS